MNKLMKVLGIAGLLAASMASSGCRLKCGGLEIGYDKDRNEKKPEPLYEDSRKTNYRVFADAKD